MIINCMTNDFHCVSVRQLEPHLKRDTMCSTNSISVGKTQNSAKYDYGFGGGHSNVTPVLFVERDLS